MTQWLRALKAKWPCENFWKAAHKVRTRAPAFCMKGLNVPLAPAVVITCSIKSLNGICAKHFVLGCDLKHACPCRHGPGVHELRQMASLLKSLLERGWSLCTALHTSWKQVDLSNHCLAPPAMFLLTCSSYPSNHTSRIQHLQQSSWPRC